MMPSVIQVGCGATSISAEAWAPPIQAACDRFQINTPLRQAAFLAQIGHESAGLTALVENLNYGAAGLMATWPTHFDAPEANQYARQPEAIANYVYAGRNGNGDQASGDGWLYRGRGCIQITGRTNYTLAAVGLGLDLVAHPELLEQPVNAALSAAWWWANHGLNELADAQNFSQITKVINGGLTGYPHRLALYGAAKVALGIA